MSCERREVGYRVAKNGAYLKFIKRYLHYDTSYVYHNANTVLIVYNDDRDAVQYCSITGLAPLLDDDKEKGNPVHI